MNSTELLIIASCFVAVATAAYCIFAMLDPYWRRVNSRIDELQGNLGVARSLHVRGITAEGSSSWLIDTLQSLGLHPAHSREHVKQRFAKAGIYHPSAPLRYLLARMVLLVMGATLTIATGLAGFLRMDIALLLACLIGCLGYILPNLWLDRAVRRYHILLQRSLPDFLDLMIICLEGGLSLQETIRRVSDELLLAHAVFARELAIVQRDVELGATVDQALKRFAIRSDYEGLRTLSSFIRETQRFGTNITEALRGHADMLRSQREQAAEENAQKVAVKILLPTLFLIFPAIFVVAVGPAVLQIQEAFAAQK